MNKIDITNTLKEILIKVAEIEIDVNNLDEKINIFEEYGINSILALEFLITVEEQFNIEIDDEYLDSRLLSDIMYLTDYVYEQSVKQNG